VQQNKTKTNNLKSTYKRKFLGSSHQMYLYTRNTVAFIFTPVRVNREAVFYRNDLLIMAKLLRVFISLLRFKIKVVYSQRKMWNIDSSRKMDCS